ncbi:MAG: class I SAM-dependent methyltransferase [Solirubrobacteraceae bacterium]
MSVISSTAEAQRDLWGARARAWCAMEVQVRPLYERALDRIGVGHGTELLDVGCGAGLAAQIAAQRGAVVSGLDATPELLSIARERVPNGEFTIGELESLPYAEDSFDAVVGFNSFQYAASPRVALEQARRVARPGAPVVIAAPGALETLATEAGLAPHDAEEVGCRWHFGDLESALSAMLAAGPAIKAIRTAGEERVRRGVAAAIEPFIQPSGGYVIGSAFRYLITTA